MKQRSTSIVYLRALAAILIFACHVAFIAGAFEASMWLNVGVPMFFIISAYLLSQKNAISHNALSFYRRRIGSIFPSYWIYLACVIVVLFTIGREPDIKSVISFGFGMFGLTGGVLLGQGHLWFITVLLFCYFITPLLHAICSYDNCRIPILLGFGVVQLVVFFIVGYPSYGIHIGTYIFVYAFYFRKKGKVSKPQMICWIFVAAFFSVVRIFYDRIFMNASHQIYYFYDSFFQPLARFTLAMALFSVFVYFSEDIKAFGDRNPRTHAIVSKFSGISYEFYLTHQFILLAFWEFVPIFHTGRGLVIWIIVSFIATIANTFALVFIKNKLIKHKSTN